MIKGVYHTDVNIISHNKNVMKMKYTLWIMKHKKYIYYYYHYVLKVYKWKVYLKNIC